LIICGCGCGYYHPQDLVPLVVVEVVVVVVVRPVLVVVAAAELRPMAVSPLQRKMLGLATVLEKSRSSKFERVHVLQREGGAVAALPRVVPVVAVAAVFVVAAVVVAR
jgi:hypothetical protein